VSAIDLTTLANLKAWLGLTSETGDAQLERLITSVSQMMLGVMERTSILSATCVETRNGTGTKRLVLANGPVTAIATLTVDGRTIPASTSVSDSGYVMTETSVLLRSGVFPEGIGNIEITYTAGYAAVPADLEQACLDICALAWKERDRIGHVSKSLDGETVTFMIKDMPDRARTILREYRKVVPV